MLKNILLTFGFIAIVLSQCNINNDCGDQSCCACLQSPNPTNGNGYLEYDPTCLDGGLNCIGTTGCKLCFKPIFGGINIGNRPICDRFSDIGGSCQDDNCCMSNQNPNPSDGNGYLEFNPACLTGGLNCVANSGCQMCYNPVSGGVNVGNRPVCNRFSTTSLCFDDSCCMNRQNPNPTDGNGYQEFEASCLEGGINCISFTGCQLCYKPVLGGINVGNRPICDRFTQSTQCSSEVCCVDRQIPNPSDGNGYLEFNQSCLTGGLNCVANTGCKLCYKPVLGGTNVGDRPICTRFSDPTFCNDDNCCISRQSPNPTDGNGYQEFDVDCLDGGLNCIANTGCKLCYKPVLGGSNVGNRPICDRFLKIEDQVCFNEMCCLSYQNANPSNGNGFLEFNQSCFNGGLNCVANTGCQLCYLPVFGSINVGNRPVCERFLNINDNVCNNDSCCVGHQNANPSDGNGYLEFNAGCIANGGGVNCVATTGCQLCYKPVSGGENIGSRPVCGRFASNNKRK